VESTNKFFSGLAATRARFAMIAATFVAASVGFVAPAVAALTSLSVGSQTGTLTSGTAGLATYVITVNRNGGTPNNNLTFSVSGLGTGATAGTPTVLTPWTGVTGTRTYRLTINTTAGRAAGATTFTVSSSSGGTTQSGTSTLTVNPALPAIAPTIAFGAAPTPTYLGGNFTVSATTNSNGNRTYSYVSGPCALVSASAGTFSSSGAGLCTVRASISATSTYLAGSADQVVTIAKANQTLSFNQPPERFVGDPDFTAVASATSGLPVSFAASGDCSVVSGSTIRVGTPATPPGSCTLTASQAGDANYNPATPTVARTFAVNSFGGTNLYAVSGTAALPGQSVTVWGYNKTGAPATQPGGVPIVVNQGDTVSIRLSNQLTVPTALLFQGQALVPDTTGVAPGASKVYTFVASQPGTFLYEAGLLHNTEYQVAMGLHGALVVRPAAASTQAYGDASTAFTKEAVLVLSEIDPALNNSPDPATFDLRNFAPRYFTINGKVYPDTAEIVAAPSDKVLLRYVNAGAQHHSMALLGLRQSFVAKDGSLLPTGAQSVTAETLAPGQTGDAIAAVPATAASGSKFAVYDGSLKLHNNGVGSSFGGMLTFIAAGTGTPGTGIPTTSGVTLNPAKTAGASAVALSASIAGNGATLTSAEYFIDTVGANGTGTSLSVVPGPNATGTASIPIGTLSALAAGNHTVYVRGLAGTTWGPVSSAVLNLDKAGPVSTGLTLTPNPSNGTVAVALHATGNDTTTGGSNIDAAEYFIGAPGASGSGTPLTVTASASTGGVTAPVASLDATIAAPGTGGVISVHSRDDLGNWGPFATITLNVITAGPTASVVSASPSPNNGTRSLSSTQPVVRVTATLTAAAGATVAGAEGFIGTVGVPGTGFPFVPADAKWDGASEVGYGDIPLANVAALPNGTATISVRGKDAAGNWGALVTTTLVIDKTAPTVSATAVPSTVAFGSPVTVNVTANDASGIAARQYWVDGSATPPANPTTFTGSSFSVSGLAAGAHTIYVRVQDTATNWSTVASVTVNVVQATNDSYNTTITNNNAGNNRTQSITVTSGSGVLANDQPTGVAGRTATPASPVVTRTGGTGSATMSVNLSSNGGFTYTLTVPNSVTANADIRDAKLGTYQFTYTETLNGAASTATVTITVN